MTAYVIATIDNVTDTDKIAQYRDLAAKAVAKGGGKYIARGGEIRTDSQAQAGSKAAIPL